MEYSRVSGFANGIIRKLKTHYLWVFGAVRKSKVAVLDRESTFAEGKTEEAEFVEQTAQRPDVRLRGDRLPAATNQKSVFISSEQYWPICGQYSG